MERAYTHAALIGFAQVGADERSKQWKTRKPRSREERAAKELDWLRLVGKPALPSRRRASDIGAVISPGHPPDSQKITKTRRALVVY